MPLFVAWRRKLSVSSLIAHVSALRLLLLALMMASDTSLSAQAFVPQLGIRLSPCDLGLARGADRRSRQPGSAATAAATPAAAVSTRHLRSRSQVMPPMLGPAGAHDSPGRPQAYRHPTESGRRWAPCQGIAGPAPWAFASRNTPLTVAAAAVPGSGEGGWFRRRKEGRSFRRGGEWHRPGAVAEGIGGEGGEGLGSGVAAGGDTAAPEAVAPDGAAAEGGEDSSWVKKRWRYALAKIKKEPLQILTIPVSAACVGWITNKLAVEMIFHPLVWRGIPLRVIDGEPLGLIGWQGIVPAKAGVMAERMVDMVTTQLVDVEEVFRRLSPGKVARLLGPEINSIVQNVYDDLAPSQMAWLPEGFGSGLTPQAVDELKGLRRGMLMGLTKDMQTHVTQVLDLKEMVVGEMLRDRSLMVSLFQKCGKAEFKFLVNSGFFFGFLLGVVQMFVWLLYDKPWTLPAGGAVVGYITNWLAIKLIFEPVDPVKMGPFVLQGLFLKRQDEVAADFAAFFSDNVLTSKKLWASMISGSRAEAFRDLVTARVVPFVSRASAVAGANLDSLTVKGLAARAADKLVDHVHVLHDYTDKTLALRATMTVQMQKMSTRTFEGVLHPVFQEEEFTLIIAGAILGSVAGFLQMLLSTKGVRDAAKKAAAMAAERAAAAADGVVEAGEGLVAGVSASGPAQVAQAAQAKVAQAAQARATGWRQRAVCTAKRCTTSTREVALASYRSLSTVGRAAAAAVADRYHRRKRREPTESNPAADTGDPSPSDPSPSPPPIDG